MISESRDEFTKWVLDSYNSLHEELFDSLGKPQSHTQSQSVRCLYPFVDIAFPGASFGVHPDIES